MDRTKKTRPSRVEFARPTYSDIGNFREVPLKQKQINARPSAPGFQRIATVTQHHSKSTFLLTRPERSHDMPPVQDIPARAKRILAKPGLIIGAESLELRDLMSMVL